jgi:hypothetical protein
MDNLLQKTADASAKIARLLALEEAAQVAAAYSLEGEEIAAAIRALKGGE